MLPEQTSLYLYNTPKKALKVYGKPQSGFPSLSSELKNFAKCPNVSTNSYLLNNKTGKTIAIDCGRWDCPVCGEKKLWRLKKAVYNVIKPWKYVRMLTLSLSSNYSDDKKKHYELLQECWRRFITECRRTKTLRADQRNFQFIRVPELHLSGYMHMHCIIDTFLRQQDLYTIWNHIIHETAKDPFLGGGVNLRAMAGAKEGARYISKYVSKLLSVESFITRRYSKSGEVVLFHKTKSSGEWSFCFGVRTLNDDEVYEELLTFFTCQNKDISSQGDLSINDLSPPFSAETDQIHDYLITDEEFWTELDNNQKESKTLLNVVYTKSIL
jgi:predicted RNA-binding Zn-ribbon protein involved in translation (DUF1610 family)